MWKLRSARTHLGLGWQQGKNGAKIYLLAPPWDFDIL
jgi:hypothetical protein